MKTTRTTTQRQLSRTQVTLSYEFIHLQMPRANKAGQKKEHKEKISVRIITTVKGWQKRQTREYLGMGKRKYFPAAKKYGEHFCHPHGSLSGAETQSRSGRSTSLQLPSMSWRRKQVGNLYRSPGLHTALSLSMYHWNIQLTSVSL